MSETILLQMKSTYKSLPGVKVLQGIDLELKAGEVYALLGENGVGKSTLIKVLGGIYIAEKDEIFIDGKEVTTDGVNASHSNGISIIHQELVLVPRITATENIFLGREPPKRLQVSRKAMEKEAQQLLDTYHMNTGARTLVKDFTIAQQQMMGVVKTISYRSRILMMDEPTSSVSDKEVEFPFSTMWELTKKGVRIAYIPRKVGELEQIYDRVTVLRDGIYMGTEKVKDTTGDHLIAVMAGQELTKYCTGGYMEPSRVVLRCKNITDRKMIKGASFGLREGEIIGFMGLVDVGRNETMKRTFGLTSGCMGDVSAEGKEAAIKSPIDAMKFDTALVPEDRKQEGLHRVQSVRFNPTIEVLKSSIKGIWVDVDKEEEITRQYIEMMDTKTPLQEQLIGNLSGGNQQKVMIERWLATAPEILILDEPTRGMDVGTKSKAYTIMNELMKKGMSIIMISLELPEILNMSGRVYVMYDNRITGCFGHEECVTQEQVMKLMAE